MALLRRLASGEALRLIVTTPAAMAIIAQALDIRGGGDLLGEQQSGHVKLIGLALYRDLLAAAIKTARGEEADQSDVEFQVEAMGTLPADYISEPEVRLNLYHSLARMREAADVNRLAGEIADRFGPPPAPVQDLLRAAMARALARALRVTRISGGPEAVALSFAPGVALEERFAAVIENLGGEVGLNDGRLLYRRRSEDAEERAAIVLHLLEALA